MKKIYEFLLWNNCGNGCTFCHQRAHERKTDDKILNSFERIKSLNTCKRFLKSNEFEKGNHILLVGGEIFDETDKEVKTALVSLLDQVLDQMLDDEIDLLYINTNLLFDINTILLSFLEKVKVNHLFERLKFTTSYDMIGRFTRKDREFLFYKNLKYLTDHYNDLKIVVNTVLTKEACKRIIENKFGADYFIDWNGNCVSMKDWMEIFRVNVNTIPYIKLDSDNAPDMPTREDVFKALLHLNSIIPGYLKQYSNNIGLKQEKLLFEYNKFEDKFVFCSSKLSDCGHSVNFKLSFKDSQACYPCEINKLLKSID